MITNYRPIFPSTKSDLGRIARDAVENYFALIEGDTDTDTAAYEAVLLVKRLEEAGEAGISCLRCGRVRAALECLSCDHHPEREACRPTGVTPDPVESVVRDCDDCGGWGRLMSRNRSHPFDGPECEPCGGKGWIAVHASKRQE